MSLFGRNDQAVTANSSTTKESTTGAPIGTYALVKGSGNGTSPISMDANAHFGNTSPGSRASVDVNMFNNTTPGAFITNMAVGIFGVSATEEANNVLNNSTEMPAHAGWNVRRAGTGPIISFTSNNTLTGYNNTDVITVKSYQAGGNAVFGNVSATNYTGTNVSVTGAVTGASTVGGVITGTSVSVTGTVTAASTVGGVITGSSVSVTGTITGTAHNGTSVSVSGAVTAASTVGGVITGSSVSVSGAVTAASTVGGVITGSSTSVTGTVTAASTVGEIGRAHV